MYPDNRLSTTLVAGPYTYPYNLVPPNKRTAYSLGGVALNNPSQGLKVQLWTAVAQETHIEIFSENQPNPVQILGQPDAGDLTLAFDQNMNPALSYVQYGMAKLYWFDTFLNQYVITDFPLAVTPRITLDDKRELQTSKSDIILGYVKNENLYIRLQRDRFLNEYLQKEAVSGRLENMGLNTGNRMQFQIRPNRT